MSDQTSAVDVDGEDIPFRFSLRNIDDSADSVQIQSAILGTEPFVLIQPGDGHISVEAAFLSPQDLLGMFGIAAATLLLEPSIEDAEEIAAEFKSFIDASLAQRAEESA